MRFVGGGIPGYGPFPEASTPRKAKVPEVAPELPTRETAAGSVLSLASDRLAPVEGVAQTGAKPEAVADAPG